MEIIGTLCAFKNKILNLQAEKSEEVGSENEEAENDPHFEPVIDLPDLVAVKTGEEGLQEIFKSRAKVFHWDHCWKDRGFGIVKIYRDTATGKGLCRVRSECSVSGQND